MKRTLIATALAMVLSACGQEPTSTNLSVNDPNHKARGQVTEPVPRRPADHLPPAPVSLTRPEPSIQEPGQRAAARSSEALSLRIDASSAESLVSSLQRAEQALTPNDLTRLRAALTVVQMMMSRKMAALAVADPNGINLTDDELLQLGFGDIHNRTIEEVIAYGIRMTPVVAPDEPSLPRF